MNENDRRVAELVDEVIEYDEAMGNSNPEALQKIETYDDSIKETVEQLYERGVDFDILSEKHSSIEEIRRTVEEEKDGRKRIEYSVVVKDGGQHADFFGQAVVEADKN